MQALQKAFFANSATRVREIYMRATKLVECASASEQLKAAMKALTEASLKKTRKKGEPAQPVASATVIGSSGSDDEGARAAAPP